jgi:hypothetical protein
MPKKNLPIPDPTNATEERVQRASKGERDYTDGKIELISTRIDGIDRATALLSETVNRVPTETQREVGHLSSLVDERFSSIQIQFKERDTRQERESRDNKVAVDAAFAAQKEAAASQDKANREMTAAAGQASREAIDKSEASTAEVIKNNQDSNTQKFEAQSKILDEAKTRLTVLESEKRGSTDTSDNHAAEQALAVQREATHAAQQTVEIQRTATFRAQIATAVIAFIAIAAIIVPILTHK